MFKKLFLQYIFGTPAARKVQFYSEQNILLNISGTPIFYSFLWRYGQKHQITKKATHLQEKQGKSFIF